MKYIVMVMVACKKGLRRMLFVLSILICFYMYIDLNPASYACMMKNARSNHCVQPFLTCYNMDGRLFIDALLKTSNRIDHVLMNLPQSATDFLDVFIGYNAKRSTAAPK